MNGPKPVYFDVFNGDADGICALHQLRLDEPREAVLVTGGKRDIRLLQKIRNVRQAVVTVLDISLDANRQDLETLLDNGCRVCYIDHHYAGDLPVSEFLETKIDPAPETCTSLIVDRLLGGRFKLWAVVAAFGDNQWKAALHEADALKMSTEQVEQLRELGELLNYNGYGAQVTDLHYHPEALYTEVHRFNDPFSFIATSELLASLRRGYAEDMDRAMAVKPMRESAAGRVFIFPHAAWSRRVAGTFVNQLAREDERAHALLVDNGDNSWLVSVRAPYSNKQGADVLCRQFPTGGGRAAAAGINKLPGALLDTFMEAFKKGFTV